MSIVMRKWELQEICPKNQETFFLEKNFRKYGLDMQYAAVLEWKYFDDRWQSYGIPPTLS